MPGTEYTRNQILTQNTNDFPNNNAGLITPAILRDYNTNVANSVLFLNETGSQATSASYALSGSYALTASFAQNATVNTSSLLVTASATLNVLTFTKGDNTTFNVTVDTGSGGGGGSTDTGSLLVTASISNATITFTKGDNTTFSQTVNNVVNANTASVVSILDDNGNTNHKVLFVNTAVATSGEQLLIDPTSGQFTYNPQSNLLTVTASLANQAVSSSFASTIPTNLNITASNLLVNQNLVVNGTASFGYTTTTSGSVVIIGDQFIVLNANPPAARYAGILVYDTGSNTTASIQWDGDNDNWIIVEETGLSALILTGPTGSKGSEVAPTVNTLLKGTGHHTVGNSNVTDNGTQVSISTPLVVTGSLTATTFSGNGALITGIVTSSFASTASFVTTAQTASTLSGLPSNAFARIGANNNFTGSVGITLTSGSRSAGFYLTDTFYFVRGNLTEQGTREFGITNRMGVIVPGFPTTSAGLYITTGSGATTYKAAIEIPNGLAWGSINLKYRTQVTGGFDATQGGLTGSLEGTSSYALQALSASYAPSSGGTAFPYTGSAVISGSLSVTGSIDAQGDIIATGSFVSINGLKGADQGAPSAGIWAVSNQYPDYGFFFVEGLANDFYEIRAGGTPTVQFDSDNGRVIASQFTGSLDGSATSASFASTASYVNPLSQPVIFSGSVRGEVSALSISSNTASLDCSTDNFFTLQLVSGSNTYINPINVNNGQTINLLISPTGSGTVTFPSTVKQVSGSAYVATTGTGTLGKDIVTFITFADGNLYLANVKNLI